MITRRQFTAALPAALAARPFLEKADLFTAGQGGYALYRIPGIVVTKRGALLAYCEARKSERGDWGTIDIFLRRSRDGGRSWDVRRKIAEIPGPHRKNPAALVQKLAAEGEVTYNNPVAIAETQTGAVHLLFCYEYMRCFHMRSGDDGRTFSAPVEITAAFEEFRSEYDWKVLATGPGHGIQLRSGRLLVPVWLSTSTGGHAHRPSVNAAIFSDDGGATWRRGGIAVPNTEEFVNPSEAAVAELADGRVLLNSRSESSAHRRVVVYSDDRGGTWSKPGFQPQLLEPVCMAGMVKARGKRLLFSNPDDVGARRNLTVQLSEDDGETWTVKKTLEPGWSGYSDLAVNKDGTVLCFYERGALGDNAYRTAALTLARFNLAWLAAA